MDGRVDGRVEEDEEVEVEHVRFDWQNQRRAVPSIKTTPAGMPIITGQGRLGAVAMGTGATFGFKSGR